MKKNLFVIVMSLLIGNMVVLLCCFVLLFVVLKEQSATALPEKEAVNEEVVQIQEKVIIEGGMITSGLEEWLQFLTLSSQNKECSIEIVYEESGTVYVEDKIQYINGRYIVEKWRHIPRIKTEGRIVEESIEITVKEYSYLKMEYIENQYVWLFCNQEDSTVEQIVTESLSSTIKQIKKQSNAQDEDIDISYYTNYEGRIIVRVSCMIEIQEPIDNSIWGEAIYSTSDTTSESSGFYIDVGTNQVIINIHKYHNGNIDYGLDFEMLGGKNAYGTILDYEIVNFGVNLTRDHKSVALKKLLSEEIIYTAEEAQKDGCIVIKDGVCISDEQILSYFYFSMFSQKRAEIRVISYEEDKIVDVMDIVYNSAHKRYEVDIVTEENEIQEEIYQYCKRFSDAYVLTNKESLTEEEWKENYLESTPGVVRSIFRK